MISADTVALLFKAQGDTDDAKKAFEELKDSIHKDTKAIESDINKSSSSAGDGINNLLDNVAGLETAFGSVGGIAAGASVVIAAVGAVAITAATALFNLTQNAADLGSEIFDAAEKTGLSATAISSLKFAAEQAGSSLDQVSSAVTKFTKTIGEAANGSESAKEKLKRLGIDPQQAVKDLDGALAKAFETISSLENPVAKANASMDAFGKSGAELIPLIKSFDGDLQSLIDTCNAYGVVIDTEGARASDEFGDALDTLTAQIRGLLFQFAKEFMPYFTSAFKALSQILINNQGNFREWGKQLSITLIQMKNNASANFRLLTGVYNAFANFLSTSWIGTIIDVFKTIAYYTSPSSWLAGQVFNVFVDNFKMSREKAEKEFDQFQQDIANREVGNNLNPGLNETSQNYFVDDSAFETAKKKADELEEKRKELAKRNLQATLESNQLEREILDATWEKYVEDQKRKLALNQLTAEQVQANLEANLTTYKAYLEQNFLLRARYEEATLKTAKEKNVLLERLNFEQAQTVGKKEEQIRKIIEDSQKKQTENIKKEAEKQTKLTEESAKNQIDSIKSFLKEREAENLKVAKKESDLLSFNQKDKLAAYDKEYLVLQNLQTTYEVNSDKWFDIETKKRNLSAEKQVFEIESSKQIANVIQDETNAKLESLKKIDDATKEITDNRKNLEISATRTALEQAARSSKFKVKAIQDLLTFEKQVLEEAKQAELEKQEAERKTYEESIKGAENEAELKEKINELYKQKALLTEEEFQLRLKEIKDRFNPELATAQNNEDAGSGFFGGMIDGLGLSVDKMLEKLEPLQTMGNIIGQAFQQVAQGVGQAVRSFVLMGSASTSFRKFAAEVIASIAQMAVVQAVWEFAQAAAMYALFFFTGNPKYKVSATQHLIAGGIYAGIAGVATVAGRAVAGNAFKNETSGAFGSSTSTATGGRTASGQPDGVIEADRNMVSLLQPKETVLKISDKSGMFAQLFNVEIENNSKVRQTIIDLTNA